MSCADLPGRTADPEDPSRCRITQLPAPGADQPGWYSDDSSEWAEVECDSGVGRIMPTESVEPFHGSVEYECLERAGACTE